MHIIPDGGGVILRTNNSFEELDARETVSYARCWTNENNQTSSIKKNIKRFGKKKNRAATRNCIQAKRFDKIPQTGRVKDENWWNWD